MRQNHNPMTAEQHAFAASYAVHPNPVQAAIAAGFSPRIAKSEGYVLLANVDVCQRIEALMRARGDQAGANEFHAAWLAEDPEDDEDNECVLTDEPDLFDRIQAQREVLALQARGGLPLPAEIEFVRKPLSRRALRAAKLQTQGTAT
jgi:phage terminase small subunit